MAKDSKGYTLLFASAVCVVCSVFVAGSAVSLRERQEENRILDRQTKVLTVAGLISADAESTREQVAELFGSRVRPIVVNLSTGETVHCEEGEAASEDCVDTTSFDAEDEISGPDTSREMPDHAENGIRAQIPRIPDRAMLYHVLADDGETVDSLILPVHGKGLWSTLYGFLALDAQDANTVKGLIFYQHAETPGLGGEVDNPTWQGHWSNPERPIRILDEEGNVAVEVAKNARGNHQVDALSGATITSNGVTYLLRFWVAEDGYGPYLNQFREERGAS